MVTRRVSGPFYLVCRCGRKYGPFTQASGSFKCRCGRVNTVG